VSISVADRKLLWGRARNECAFPSCSQPLTDVQPGSKLSQTGPLILGEEAHIRSAKIGGPRYDAEYDPALVDTYENLLLLCPTHHALIDKDNGSGFEIAQLITMRRRHERKHEVNERLERTLRSYVGDQYDNDDRILFEQVDLNGPTVESMFVDVPFAARLGTASGLFLQQVHEEFPGDVGSRDTTGEWAVAGAAQSLLHPEWRGNALVVGGPGQGKSTLLQFLCQFHRARFLGQDHYTGIAHGLQKVTSVVRFPIRIDLRKYATWPGLSGPSRFPRRKPDDLPSEWAQAKGKLEFYLAEHVQNHSSATKFEIDDLADVIATRPVLLALDGLDEVANLATRDRVANEIVKAVSRLTPNAADLVVVVATRPGGTTASLWSSPHFPIHHLRALSPGLRLQYLYRWSAQAGLDGERAERLKQTFTENVDEPHVRELASNPMQLAILLHLLHRRGLLPQQRTQLYEQYVQTFLDREDADGKEPLVQRERVLMEDVHAFLGWHLQSRAELGLTTGAISREDLWRVLQDYLKDRHEEDRKLAQSFFSALTARVLCLVEREAGFEFEVQSLREYFAARYIFETAPTNGSGNSRDDCINELLLRPYWINVLRFLVGMLSKGEVRALAGNFTQLRDQRKLGAYPFTRAVAVQLLEDRVFLSQRSSPIQEIVDYALESSGVIFAEDGLLDPSGKALVLSEGAGRAQLVEHAQRRLLNEDKHEVRQALVGLLRRHASTSDLKAWWWSDAARSENVSWLISAADLGVLGNLTNAQLLHLQMCVAQHTSEYEPLATILLRGGYDAGDDNILKICMNEISNGLYLIFTDAESHSPVAQLLRAASSLCDLVDAVTRPARAPRPPSPPKGSRRQRRRGGRPTMRLRGLVMQQTDAILQCLSSPGDDAKAWATTLPLIQQTWGDSWLLRQVIMACSQTITLPEHWEPAIASGSEWQQLVAWSKAASDNRTESSWWLRQIPPVSDNLATEHWIFGLLLGASSRTIGELMTDLNALLDGLSGSTMLMLDQALVRGPGRIVRQVGLREEIRLGQVSIGPRTASLLRNIANDSTRQELDRILLANLLDMVKDEGISRSTLLTIAINSTKVLPVSGLHSTRCLLPSNWGSAVRIGTLSQAKARQVLAEPELWPTAIVQDAAQKATSKLASSLPALAIISDRDRWFP
jgi:hypothetical protein